MSVDARMRESARRALGDALMPSRAGDDGVRALRSSIDRVSIDVRVGERVEAVTLLVRDGELRWSCTDGSAGRESGGTPGSAYVQEALRWLAGSGSSEVSDRGSVARTGEPVEPPRDEGVAKKASELGGALDAVVTSIVRAGIAGRESPSVRDAIERLTRAFTPVPTSIARFVGRLERAMAIDDACLVARLLHGASTAIEELAGPRMRVRLGEWLGTPSECERIVDREFVEIARESLDGVQRAAIERRYLLDLTSGEMFTEERARGDVAPSIGPCPRKLFVGLGEVERGVTPPRIRVLQYTATLEVGRAERERIEVHALRRVSMWVDSYRAAIETSMALSEPVQLVACGGMEGERLVDAVGEPIPMAMNEDRGAIAALDVAVRAATPEWIVGRLIDIEGAITMIPCSMGSKERILRLR